jgi:NTE family protein
MIAHVRLLTSLIAILLLFSCAPKEIKPPPKPAKVAVVLGAGACKGFAHVGVLKVLEANRIPIHMIVGTSAGSVVGSLYAYGFNAFDLQKIAHGLKEDDVIDLGIPDNGFVKGEKLEAYVNNILKHTPMEKLRIPFYAVATEIQTGREVVFGTGNTGTAVRASCAIPGVFRPVILSGRSYVDGGLVSPVAVEAARRQGADVVIAVDVSGVIDSVQPTSTIETLLQSVNIMYAKLAELQLTKADVVIRPKLKGIGSKDFEKRNEAILEGERAAAQALPGILPIIEKLKQEGRLI